MKTLLKFLNNEIISYLFFGVCATVVYFISRLAIFAIMENAVLSTALANIIAVIFAFITNDTFVFKQKQIGWQARFIKFFTARLATLALDLVLSFIFVDKFPEIIGQFVGNNLTLVNSIESLFSQVLIIILNYFFSKIFIFKDNK